MPKFEFTAAIAVRAYGTITVQTETLAAAKAKICETHFDMATAFEPHGGGEDDYDYNYQRPAVYLDYVSEDDGEEIELNEELPDPKDDPNDNPFDPESPEGRAFEDGRIDATGTNISEKKAVENQTFAFLIAWGRNVAEDGSFTWCSEAATMDDAIEAAYAEMAYSAGHEIDRDKCFIIESWEGWNPWIDPRPVWEDLRNARAALSNLLDQVHQMKGMFPDGDGNIANAIADAEVELM